MALLTAALTAMAYSVHRAAPPRMMSIEPASVEAHDKFLSEVTMTMPPKALASVVGLLLSRGETLVEPGLDATLHPLLIPLTRDGDGDGEVHASRSVRTAPPRLMLPTPLHDLLPERPRAVTFRSDK